MVMGIRFLGRRAWGVIAIASVAVAILVWATHKPPTPEIPRPGPSAFIEPEVRADVAEAARRVELQPRSAAAWGEYGIILRAYRQHAEADQCFQVAADLDPADGRWPYLIGSHLATADPAAATPWLERATRGTVPAAARETVRARLAETLLAAGRPADALAALEPDALTSSPQIRLAAARAAAAVGDDRAADEFLGDLDDHPLAARQVLLLRSEICRRQGRTSYANYLSERAEDAPGTTLWPDPLTDPIPARDLSRGGRLDEAARLLRVGQPVEAERLLRPLTTGPSATDARAFVGLSEARQAQGDGKGALLALGQAVRIDPKNLAANYQIGLLHFDAGEQLWAAGRKDEALAEFRVAVTWLDQALAINPDFGKGLLLKGAALHRFLGQRDAGLALLRRFVQLRPEVGEGHLELGQALAEIGQTDAAAASLRRAADLARPGDRRAVDALDKLAPAARK
jgi:tetratricopeptide (TPR) repeat protein